MLLGQHLITFRKTRRHARKQACSRETAPKRPLVAEAASAGCKHPSWCSLSIQIHRRASASCTHAEACRGRRSDRSATERTRRSTTRADVNIAAETNRNRFRRPSLLRNSNQGSSIPSNARAHLQPKLQVRANMQPPVPVQDWSARPKPKHQRPKTLKRRKRRLRENPDWVKLEPAASREPPRHQRQSSA